MHLFQVSTHVSQFTNDIKILAEKVESALKEQEKIWRTTNANLPRRVDLLSKQKAEKKEEHYAEIEEVIAYAKASDVVAIMEAKIKLAEDLEH